MARVRTCFASSVCCSDGFSDLSAMAQALYYRLGFEADSDGAIDNVRSVMRSMRASEKDLEALIDGQYLIQIDDVLFIKHWWVNNKQDKINYRPGRYQNELKKLSSDSSTREYVSSDLHQSDISLTSVHNIKELKVIESKLIEDNSKEFNESNQTDVSLTSVERQTFDCPKCGAIQKAYTTGDGFGQCEECRSLWALPQKQIKAGVP